MIKTTLGYVGKIHLSINKEDNGNLFFLAEEPPKQPAVLNNYMVQKIIQHPLFVFKNDETKSILFRYFSLEVEDNSAKAFYKEDPTLTESQTQKRIDSEISPKNIIPINNVDLAITDLDETKFTDSSTITRQQNKDKLYTTIKLILFLVVLMWTIFIVMFGIVGGKNIPVVNQMFITSNSYTSQESFIP